MTETYIEQTDIERLCELREERDAARREATELRIDLAEANTQIANLRDDAIAAHELAAQATRRVAHLEQVIETATDHVHKWLALTLNGQPGGISHIERAWTTLVLQVVTCYGVSAAGRDASPSPRPAAIRGEEVEGQPDTSSTFCEHEDDEFSEEPRLPHEHEAAYHARENARVEAMAETMGCEDWERLKTQTDEVA